MGLDKLIIKSSLHGTMEDILDNVTTLHLHCNFPGILHIYHQFHWFQQMISFSLPIPLQMKRVFVIGIF